MQRLVSERQLRVGVLIFLCFLLASEGWLSWLYRIMELVEPASVDLLTMVFGYLVQAVGIMAFMLAEQGRDGQHERRAAVWALVLYPVCLAPATLTTSLPATLAFGYVANALCGMVQGYYLCCLASLVDESRRGVVFGGAYGASTVCTWLISLVGGGFLTRGVPCLVLCALIAAAAFAVVRGTDGPADAPDAPAQLVGNGAPAAQRLALACAAVTLVSLVKTVGFSFPTTDLVLGVDLELSRVLYGAGLVLAGVAPDRDRATACSAASPRWPCPS